MLGGETEDIFTVRCSIKGVTGDYNFGGDVVTTVIVDELRGLIEESAPSIETEAPDEPTTSDSTWLRNFSSLFRLAEAVKVGLRTATEVDLVTVTRNALRNDEAVLQVGTHTGGTQSWSGADVASAFGARNILSRSRIEQRVAGRIAKTKQMMRELLGDRQADVFVLAGRGASWSQYASVARELVRDPDRDVVVPELQFAKKMVSFGAWFADPLLNSMSDSHQVLPDSSAVVCPAFVGVALHHPIRGLRLLRTMQRDLASLAAIAPGVPIPQQGVAGIGPAQNFDPEGWVTIGRQFPGAAPESVEVHIFEGMSSVSESGLSHRLPLDKQKAIATTMLASKDAIDNECEVLATECERVNLPSSIPDGLHEPAQGDFWRQEAYGVALPILTDPDFLPELDFLIRELSGFRRKLAGLITQVRGFLSQLNAWNLPRLVVWKDLRPSRAQLIAAATTLEENLIAVQEKLDACQIAVDDAGRTHQVPLPNKGERGDIEIHLSPDLEITVFFVTQNPPLRFQLVRQGPTQQFYKDATVWRLGTRVLSEVL